MKVSIVITNHNYAEYVGDAVESALAQTHPEVEVIVVDDGSSDDSPSVLARYQDKRLRVAFQENQGQGGACNTGYSLAKGELVIFLDADDVLLPTAAELAASVAIDGGVAQVHWPVTEVDAEGEPTGETTPRTELEDSNLLAKLLEFGPLQWSFSPTSGNAWTRRYLESVMPLPAERFRVAADAYLAALAPFYGHTRALTDPQALYRRHRANSSSRSFDAQLASDVAFARKLIPIAAEHARALGLDADPARWERVNWNLRLACFLEELDSVVGRTVPFILVDGTELAVERRSGRQVTPFLEHEGDYWGKPDDDTHAIDELERLRVGGAHFLVLAWPSFWWRDAYPGFLDHLRTRYGCVLENERLQVFDLTR
jgi:glycosyltransferase involved in cell wall biosynthesis